MSASLSEISDKSSPRRRCMILTCMMREKMIFLLVMFLMLDFTWGHLPSQHFKDYNVIHPVLHNPRVKRSTSSSNLERSTSTSSSHLASQIHDEDKPYSSDHRSGGPPPLSSSHSPGDQGGHLPHLTLSYLMREREVVVDLQLNTDLIPEGYFEKHQHKGGQVVHRPDAQDLQLCHYQGKVRGISSSWAALSTCDGGIQGAIFDGQHLNHVEKVENPNLLKEINPGGGDGGNPHFIYSHDDLHENLNRTCGHKSSLQEDLNSILEQSSLPRHKRDISSIETGDINSKLEIKGPWDANKRSRYVELVIVVDNTKFKENGEDLVKVHRKCKDIANIANALYAPLNIYIALVGVVVWSEYDEITLSTDADTTLTNFLHYRRERLVKDHPNDNAQLLTGIQFDQGVVGKALKGPMCTYEFSGGVSIWHSEVIGIVAVTMAHEMGHNFGMDHDSDNCKCPEQQCIMGPSSSTMKWYFWSSCSLEHLALAFEHGMDYCLRNKPRTLFGSPVCGNGFVEPGEQCDCGLKDHCDNPCCDADTCRLHANATCATGKCCDLTTCQPKLPGEVCRRAEHECDLPEFCTGKSEFCPGDVFKVDGIPCKVGQSFCYQGSCRTHSDQCRLLWGPSGQKSDNQCYEHNRLGTRHGNCGYNRLNDSYIPCTETDVRCGMLHCSHLNERLEFGMESVAILSHSFINSGGRIIPCRTALVDLGLEEVDPGLAPEGAMCGPDSLCVNQKCMPVASLRIGPQSCQQNCHGHGVCNSVGHCHCEVGFKPPDCIHPGPGGSLESGPASNPKESSTMSTLLYIFFFGVVPLVVLASCLFYLHRGKLRLAKAGSHGEEGGGFIKVERRRTSRPPSRLNIESKDISGPISLETGNSAASSPTHVLLPRSKTQVSEINDPSSASTVQSHSETKISGMFSAGVFKLGGFRYKKPGNQDDAGSDSCSELQTETASTKSKSRASDILKSLSSSIPSQLCRPMMKKHSIDNSRYEVRIEPRVQETDHSPVDQLDPILKVDLQQEASLPPVTSSSLDSPDVATRKPPVPIKSPTSPNQVKAEPSGRSKSSTLPPSMSLVSVPVEPPPTQERKNSSPVVTMTSPKATNNYVDNPKLAFPHSSSFQQPTSPPHVTNNKPEVGKKPLLPESTSAGSIRSMSSNKEMWYRNPSSYLNRHASYRSTGGKDSAVAKPTGATAVTSTTTSNLDDSKATTVEAAQKPESATSKPEVSASKPAVSGSKPGVAGPAAKPPIGPASKPSLSSSAKPVEATKPSVGSTNTQPPSTSSSSKPVTTLTLSPFTQNTTNPSLAGESKPVVKHTLWSVMDGDKPKSEEKPMIQMPVVETTERQKAPVIVEKASTATKAPSKEKSSSKPVSEDKSKSTDKPGKVKETEAAKKVKSPDKEVSLKGDTDTESCGGEEQAPGKPHISRPVLQTATPTAASLIARAPSTGVSQSSILAGKEKESDPFKPPKEKGRRAIFCDPITLPSPTSPNNPPIIHQPAGPPALAAGEGVTAGASGQGSPPPPPNRYSEAIITPIWSTQATPTPCQVEECDLGGDSPSHQSDKSTLSKLISNVKRTPSLSGNKKGKGEVGDNESLTRKHGKVERSSLRALEISSPVLQTQLDTSNLVPVSRSNDVVDSKSRLSPDSNTSSLTKSGSRSTRGGSPVTKRQAPKPPTKPARSPDIVTSSTATSSKVDDINIKSKPRYQAFSSSAQQRTAAPTSTWEQPSTKPKSSSSDDSLDSKKDPAASTSTASRQRRPVSIATSKPNRPTAPPPKPPPSSRSSSGSASPDDSSMNLMTRPGGGLKSGLVSAPLATNEPIYDTITEEPEASGARGDQSAEEFETPVGSPVLSKKSPDTMSTCSSGEEDLMKEILKEVTVKSDGESIYSSLMKKGKHKRKKSTEKST